MTTIIPNNSSPNVRILVVDDDPAILELLDITITSFGFDCVKANNGLEAIDILEKQEFTLVITDMVMPEVDGMKLLQHIKTNFPNTSVVVVTGFSGIYTYVDVINAGASDFILKPFNSDELEAKINRIMREREMFRRLEFLSNCDPLTGLFNRRYLDIKTMEEVRRAVRQGYQVFLLLADIDNFKLYNDRFGHPGGDQLLIKVAKTLNECTRDDVDLVFRHGGDEFAVLTPYISLKQLEQVGKRIITTFREHSAGESSLSLGVAEFLRTDDNWEDDIFSLFRRADKALYNAKAQGRNKLVLSS